MILHTKFCSLKSSKILLNFAELKLQQSVQQKKNAENFSQQKLHRGWQAFAEDCWKFSVFDRRGIQLHFADRFQQWCKLSPHECSIILSIVFLSLAIELYTAQRWPEEKRWHNEHDVTHKRFCTHLSVPPHAHPNCRTTPNGLVLDATARTLDTHTETTFACTDTTPITFPAYVASR